MIMNNLPSLCISPKIVETYRNQNMPKFSKRKVYEYDVPMATMISLISGCGTL
jgi:hypothetical protein